MKNFLAPIPSMLYFWSKDSKTLIIFSVLSYKNFPSKCFMHQSRGWFESHFHYHWPQSRISQDSRSWGGISQFSLLEIQTIEFLQIFPWLMEIRSMCHKDGHLSNNKLTTPKQNIFPRKNHAIFFFQFNMNIKIPKFFM